MRHLFLSFLFAGLGLFATGQSRVPEFIDDESGKTHKDLRGEALYESGVKKAEAGDHGSAIQLFRLARKMGLNNSDLFYSQGRSFDELGMRDSACVYFGRAAELGDAESAAFVRVRCR